MRTRHAILLSGVLAGVVSAPPSFADGAGSRPSSDEAASLAEEREPGPFVPLESRQRGAQAPVCSLQLAEGTIDCNDRHVSITGSGDQRVLAIDLETETGLVRRVDVFARICNPRGWVLHVSDSPSGNGFAVDGSDSDHDAETWLLGTSLWFASRLDPEAGVAPTLLSIPGALGPESEDANGCSVAHLVVVEAQPRSEIRFDTGGQPIRIHGMQSFALDYEMCEESDEQGRGALCDWEDRDLDDSWRWYIGLNRTVGDGLRAGSGIQEACVVLGGRDEEPESCLRPADPTRSGPGLLRRLSNR